ncbi:MAG: 3-dehydroquinate synthase [Planctomycetota bacterium]
MFEPVLTIHSRDRDYPVYLQSGLLSQFEIILQSQKYSTLFLLTDSLMASLYSPFLESLAQSKKNRIQVIPAGEKNKSWESAQLLFRQMLAFQLDRKSLFVAFGGGVISDLGGYCASQYLRGISYVLFPTTLLAQVDACVGGKVAINFEQTKNLLGHIYPPYQVWIDPDFIQTLPPHEIRSGLGEILKYGMIGPFFLLEQILSIPWAQWKEKYLLKTIQVCLETKKNIVEQDEYEEGIRAKLNFGHTLGHALESAPHFSWTHGEAVALGMLLMTQLAWERKYLKEVEVLNQLKRCLQFLNFPLQMTVSGKELQKQLSRDKKNVGKQLNVVLPIGKGEVQTHCLMDVEDLLNWISSHPEYIRLT